MLSRKEGKKVFDISGGVPNSLRSFACEQGQFGLGDIEDNYCKVDKRNFVLPGSVPAHP